MNRWLLAFAFLLAGCRESAVPQAPVAKTAASHLDANRDNVLLLTRGAAVVTRSAEFNLEASAVHAIDTLPTTGWTSPPGGSRQTLVYSLPAPARIEQLGVTTPDLAKKPGSVAFDASNDGVTWTPVLTMPYLNEGKPSLKEVTPFVTRYLRVRTLEPTRYYTSLVSIYALGRETGPVTQPSIEGCWRINGRPAAFAQRGANIVGVIENGETPTYLTGGSDGRLFRFTWIRGMTWGYAVVTLDPAAKSISGLPWFENVTITTSGIAWMGERGPCTQSSLDPVGIPVSLLQRSGRWHLYGVRFDDTNRLSADSAPAIESAARVIAAGEAFRFRVIAREFSSGSAEKDRAATTARIAAVRDAFARAGADLARVDFIATGSDWPTPLDLAAQRLLYGGITLEVQGPAR